MDATAVTASLIAILSACASFAAAVFLVKSVRYVSTHTNGMAKSAAYLIVGLIAAAVFIAPSAFALVKIWMPFSGANHDLRFVAVGAYILSLLTSATPAFWYLLKHSDVLYEAGYWKRLK